MLAHMMRKPANPSLVPRHRREKELVWKPIKLRSEVCWVAERIVESNFGGCSLQIP